MNVILHCLPPVSVSSAEICCAEQMNNLESAYFAGRGAIPTPLTIHLCPSVPSVRRADEKFSNLMVSAEEIHPSRVFSLPLSPSASVNRPENWFDCLQMSQTPRLHLCVASGSSDSSDPRSRTCWK